MLKNVIFDENKIVNYWCFDKKRWKVILKKWLLMEIVKRELVEKKILKVIVKVEFSFEFCY